MEEMVVVLVVVVVAGRFKSVLDKRSPLYLSFPALLV